MNRLFLFVIFLVALALRVDVALRSPNIIHPDEIFQTLEPAHRLAFGYGVITWEWREGVRSWVFPAFLAAVMRTTEWMGAGSSGYLRGIAIVLSLVSLITVWFAFAWSKCASGKEAAIIAAVACAVWWELVYYAPKALNEVAAGHLLLPGLYLGVYGDELPERRRLFLAGFFCGLAVSLRIQLAPAVVFAALYFCHPKWRQRMMPVFSGLLLPVLAFGVVDAITWSYPFQSSFLYYWVNVVEGRSVSIGGAEPWYWYLIKLAKYLGPVVPLAVVGLRRSPFLGWQALIIVGSHSVLAHKEVRYLYPVRPVMLTLAALGIVELMEAYNARSRSPLSSRGIVLVGLAFFVLTSSSVALLFPHWAKSSGGLISMDRLSRDSGVCGVGIYGGAWGETGGYSHLHRNVPIVLTLKDSDFMKEASSFDSVVLPLWSRQTLNISGQGFKLEGCWNEVCLYRRLGSCSPPAAQDEINSALRQTGY